MRGGRAELGGITEVCQLDHRLGGHVFHHNVLRLQERQRANVRPRMLNRNALVH